MDDQTPLSELTPRLMANIGVSRSIMSQSFQGSFQLILRKISRLPSFSRPYTKGDPIQLIDWKAFARNDQLIVREDRDEASSRVMICLDTSDTVFWPKKEDFQEAIVQKWEVICRIGLHLAYLHLKQGDVVHFFFIDQNGKEPQTHIRWESSQEIATMFSSLESSRFDLDTLRSRSQPYLGLKRKYHLGYLISDFLNHRHEKWLREYARGGRIFHVLSSRETDLKWLESGYCYFDETEDKKEFLGAKLKGSNIYYDTLDKWSQKIQKRAKQIDFDYMQVTENTALNHYLQSLLRPISERG